MNVDTGEIKSRDEVAKILKNLEKPARKGERRSWMELTAEEHEQLRRMTPAERVAAKVRGYPPFTKPATEEE